MIRFILFACLCCELTVADETQGPNRSDDAVSGQTLLVDDFDRADGSNTKDAIGNGWSSNSGWRANGRKQAFLQDGHLVLKTAEGADHAVVMFHDLPKSFQNGIVEVRFRAERGTGFAVDLNDPKCRTVHSGHIANVAVTKRGVTIKDSKSGAMDLEHRRRLKSGTADATLKKQIAATVRTFPLPSTPDAVHVLSIAKCQDQLSVLLDGRLLGSHRSAGFSHPTIRKISISVPGIAHSSPKLDSIRVLASANDCEPASD
ncbi:MAG: DUF1080 domain-containing protein [Fuerstiella sp.]